MPSTSVEPASILRNAVVMEIQGKEFYERAAEKIDSPKGKGMFLRLADQERTHVEILEEQLNMYIHEKVWYTLGQLRRRPSAPKISVFEDKDIRAIAIGPNAGELEVLRLGMNVEKKSVEYYKRAIGTFRDSNAKSIFRWLVEQETRHLELLQAEYDRRKQP